MARYVFDSDPDPVALLDELFYGSARDYKDLPLGNIEEHYKDRLILSYLVLCLFALVRDIGRLTPPVQIRALGARFQDKRTSREYPAAHLVPCDMKVRQPGRPEEGIYDLLHNPFSQMWVKRQVFGRTDRVHHYTNVADSACERSPVGMVGVFATACETVANSSRTAQSVFHSELFSGYRGAVRDALQRTEARLTPFERAELNRGPRPVDRFGHPLTPRPTDYRLGSPDLDARAAARMGVIQVLRAYAAADAPGRHELADAAGKVEALRFNEGPFR